jgi:hypothetical protein
MCFLYSGTDYMDHASSRSEFESHAIYKTYNPAELFHNYMAKFQRGLR